MPLEVMLQAMRRYHEQGQTAQAVAVARDAAPYCHARLSSMQMEHSGSVGHVLSIVEEVIGERRDGPLAPDHLQRPQVVPEFPDGGPAQGARTAPLPAGGVGDRG
jgi:hypothetical protein